MFAFSCTQRVLGAELLALQEAASCSDDGLETGEDNDYEFSEDSEPEPSEISSLSALSSSEPKTPVTPFAIMSCCVGKNAYGLCKS